MKPARRSKLIAPSTTLILELQIRLSGTRFRSASLLAPILLTLRRLSRSVRRSASLWTCAISRSDTFSSTHCHALHYLSDGLEVRQHPTLKTPPQCHQRLTSTLSSPVSATSKAQTVPTTASATSTSPVWLFWRKHQRNQQRRSMDGAGVQQGDGEE